MSDTIEHDRIQSGGDDDVGGWRRWGPYVADRAWATVREDYSPDGNAWDYFPHELARSKAYRWGEDGIAAICDRYQLLVFAPAFWNGRDPILKERYFGVTSNEGNHGEDVKEYYYYVDNIPSHSYMKFVYKYPHAEFPYRQLVEENRRRTSHDPEYELIDTGVFDGDRYFEIVIEYAKIVARRHVHTDRSDQSRARAGAIAHLAASLVSEHMELGEKPGPEPRICLGPRGSGFLTLVTDDSKVETLSMIPVHYRLGSRTLYAPIDGLAGPEPLFTDNETNMPRVYGPQARNRRPYVKDAFHRRVINREQAVNPAMVGTKSALHYRFDAVEPGGSVVVRLRLTDITGLDRPLDDTDRLIAMRKAEADAFYAGIQPPHLSDDERMVQRQALAGLLWTKQTYIFDVHLWLHGDNPKWPPPESRKTIRNQHWRHLNSLRVMSVPDKWEYPWFAAWDLAFHAVVFALIDGPFAKHQLWVLLFEQFQHPNGQIPAYEWEFSDLNPPVHAWAVWRVYNMDRIRSGKADRPFLERCFHKLLINFAWWINKVDREGNNIFEGGFLGLDNITVIDRSERASDGSRIEQSDATGWIGMFCLVLMRIALELAKENSVYEGLASKFFQHYVYVARAMKHMGNRDYQLWDEEDGFFYDVLTYPGGRYAKFRVRSMVGLIPLFAIERLEEKWIEPFTVFRANFEWFMRNRSELARDVVHTVERDGEVTHVLTILNQNQIQRLTARLCDPDEFFSSYGIRSLSKAHESHPFEFDGKSVGYEPAESAVRLKGGNSNWRGPIWFPMGFLIIESLRKLGTAFGGTLGAHAPWSPDPIPFHSLAHMIANRYIRIFTRNHEGHRPVFGPHPTFQGDPHWRDLILFYEYFHGDNGMGLGASHQTGWTALVASLIDEWRR